MTDDMRLLLRILLEQELREVEPEMQRPRKKREAEREDGIDYAPAESRGKTKRMKDTMKEERAEDFKQARSDTSIIYRSKWGRNRKGLLAQALSKRGVKSGGLDIRNARRISSDFLRRAA